MPTTATFLHVTDTHLVDGAASNQADIKTRVPKIEDTSKLQALKVTAAQLATRLSEEKRLLDGILFTGDAQDKGMPNGHVALRGALEESLRGVLREGWKFVAVPGNHDIPKGSEPGSADRYAEFMKAWRDNDPKAVTPWFDDLDADPIPATEYDDHRFVAQDKSWEIYPINSCNWSHTQVALPDDVKAAFEKLAHEISLLDSHKAVELAALLKDGIRAPVERQLLYDIARVSGRQLAAMKPLIRAGSAAPRAPLRIVVLHHHLMAPTLREEVRAFSDILNLASFRTYLRQNEVDVVIHGHKHVDAIAYDSVYDHGASSQSDPRRLLVISGGTFDGGQDESGMSLIGISGLPGAPRIDIERIPLGREGFDLKRLPAHSARLWRINEHVPGGPVVIHGDNINDVYARAVQAATEEAKMAMLIVHLDLPQPELDGDGRIKSLPFPIAYPDPNANGAPSGADRQSTAAWAEDLADWWQLPRSSLESRIPYIHGTRLRRFASQFDQIKRIVALLKSSSTTSRAVAVLVDPLRDFRPNGDGEDFASFCLIQFRRRSKDGGTHLDCTAYYRAQEFKHWWPINVAELRRLQIEVSKELNWNTGRITTIAADARAVATRSPGQVAIPVVDRWLDQSPEKLIALASHLCGDARKWGDGTVLNEWRKYLNFQRQCAEPAAFNPDGAPVAVEALEVLAAYMEAHSDNDEHFSATTARLRRLARENRNYERSSKDRRAFNDWSENVRILCHELLETIKDTPNVAAADAVATQ